jgi:hypothetical protein
MGEEGFLRLGVLWGAPLKVQSDATSTYGGLKSGVTLGKCSLRTASRRWQLTHFWLHSTVKDSQTLPMSAMKIQVGQLWKKDATGDIYLVTRLYSEALNTVAVLRKSGAEGEAQIRVRVERAAKGQTIPGFSRAQEEESY